MAHNLRLIRRFIAFTAVLAGLTMFALGTVHAQVTPPLSSGAMTGLHLGFGPALAAEFPGCAAKVAGVPSSLVVERMSGQVVRLPFDTAWKINHDHNAANDVWVRGQCARVQ